MIHLAPNRPAQRSLAARLIPKVGGPPTRVVALAAIFLLPLLPWAHHSAVAETAAAQRLTLSLPGAPESTAAPEGEFQAALREFKSRLPVIREQLPTIVASASDYAQRIAAHPEALLNVPYRGQESFSEEFINRAGGLAHTYPTEAPERRDRATEHDVVIMAARSWEESEAAFREQIERYRERGWKITLIGSAADRPDDLDGEAIDYFIDNGAPSGAAEHGRINVLANVVVGWMWCAEYVAAMTRQGKIPAILISISYDHAHEHNRELQTPEGRHWIGPCEHPVPEGELALAYHDRVRKMVADLGSRYIQDQIDAAAAVIVERLEAGETVGLTGLGHLIYHEPMQGDVRSPMTPFNRRRDPTFTETLDPGELLVWVAYMGMNSARVDFASTIEEAGVDLVTSYAPAPPDYESQQEPLRNLQATPKNQLAHIDQPWLLGDAELELPCEPGRMAPISGICRTLIFRMLDDAVAERITASGQ